MSSVYHPIKTLSSHGKHVLQRATDASSREKVILKTIAPRALSVRSIAALENEYAALKSITSEFVVRPLALLKDRGGHPTLVLEDLDGIDLGQFLREHTPLSLEMFYPIALSLVRGISAIHAAGIIHKDIHPRNVIIHPGTLQTKIIDFSIATGLARESQEINVKGLLEGSLPYLSPEQTGRINRYLDYRSDFYSIGVTFYEMLTGEPLFRASDALGYIAAHVTKKPPRADAKNPDLPRELADLIDILLAKAADDRYQSSAGLIYDLTKLHERFLGSETRRPYMTLRTADRSERFDLPQKLYGRGAAIARLFAKFDEAVAGKPGILLVRGNSGIGKSTLIHEVYRKFSDKPVFFLKGKFDQLSRDIPYSAIIQAFTGAMDQLTRMEPAQYQSFAAEMKGILGPNGEVITNLMPEFKSMIGTPLPLPELNPQEAGVRVSHTLIDFISAFSRPHEPLVLFLDDMQWADLATLELLSELFTKVTFKNILLILSYRDSEVLSHHPLALALDHIAQKTAVDAIDLPPLTLEHVSQMIADTLKVERERVEEISAIVTQKTQGNPFFVEEFLGGLWQQKLIWFDHAAGAWRWDDASIRELKAADKIVDFLLSKLQTLDEGTREALGLAAALGNKFRLSVLSLILQKDGAATLCALEQAIRAGLIIPLDRGYHFLHSLSSPTMDQLREFDTLFKFQHDRIQQVSYGLIPSGTEPQVHLRIARILDQNRDKWAIHLNEIAHQYHESYQLITDDDERLRLMNLSRQVAGKALEANAHATALTYLDLAMELHREEDWLHHFDLMSDIAKNAAKTHYFLNLVEEGDRIIEQLLAGTEEGRERAEILTMQSLHYSNLGFMQKATDRAIAALGLCGYPFPRKIAPLALLWLIIKLIVVLSLKKSESILSLPKVVDKTHYLILKNLATLVQTAFNLGERNLQVSACFRLVLATLKFGFSPFTTFAFGGTSGAVMGVFKMASLSRKLGVIAVELDKRNESLSARSNTATILACFIYYWHYDNKDMAPHFNHALQLGYQAGNNFFRASAAACHARYLRDLTVQEAFQLNRKMVAIAAEAGCRQNHEALLIIQGAYANLLGLTPYGHSLSYEECEEVRMRRHVKETDNHTAAGGFIALKLEALVLRERWRQAVWFARKWKKSVFGVAGTKYEALYHFYFFLALAGFLQKHRGPNRWLARWQLAVQRWCLRVYYRNRPQNFSDMESIVVAEMAALSQQPLARTLGLFDEAIAVCKEHSRAMAALACHRAFLFALRQDLQRLAAGYFKEAVYYYEQWGAFAISRFLTKKYSGAHALKQAMEPTVENLAEDGSLHKDADYVTTLSGRSLTLTTDTSGLNIASLTKAIRAIFEKDRPAELIETIVRAMMEYGCATRGALILKEEDDSLACHALIDDESGEKILSPAPLTSHNLPRSFLYNAYRTGRTEFVGDAREPHELGHDPFFEHSPARSALAMPISFKGGIVGVAYLQNNQTVYAFSAENLESLEILATNAAASIVNTRLHLSLEAKVHAKTRAVTSMLENVAQGILTISGDDLHIQHEYSRHLEQLLDNDRIAGEPLADVLLGKSSLNDDQRSSLLTSLSALIGSSRLSYLANGHLLPREIRYGAGEKKKTFTMDWSPILDEHGNIEKILLVIRDVTEERHLLATVNRQQKEVAIFMEIARISSKQFGDFIEEGRAVVTHYLALTSPAAADLEGLFIHLHTLKGLARTYDFSRIVENLHHAEQMIAHATRTGVAQPERIREALHAILQDMELYATIEALRVDPASKSIMTAFQAVEGVLDRHMSLHLSGDGNLYTQLCQVVYPCLEDLLQQEIDALGAMAAKLGKETPRLSFINDGHRYPRHAGYVLQQLFVHLFSNALDHGIEPAEERVKRGKPPVGTITITYGEDEGRPILLVADDGRGLDLAAIRQAAVSNQFVASDAPLSPQATAELIFKQEFSTKSTSSLLSGRGVGMNALKFLLHGCGGDVRLELDGEDDPSGCRHFRLNLQLGTNMVASMSGTGLKLAG